MAITLMTPPGLCTRLSERIGDSQHPLAVRHRVECAQMQRTERSQQTLRQLSRGSALLHRGYALQVRGLFDPSIKSQSAEHHCITTPAPHPLPATSIGGHSAFATLHHLTGGPNSHLFRLIRCVQDERSS